MGDPSKLSVIRKSAALARVTPTLFSDKLLFIINRYSESYRQEVRQDLYMSVGVMTGVMKDKKLRNLRVSHTLGCSWNWNTDCKS
jgi:hypothetical protein